MEQLDIEDKRIPTYDEGYNKGVEDTEVKYREQIISLTNIKAEHDRALVMLRNNGVTKDRTKKLSVAVYVMINYYKTLLRGVKKDEK